MRRLWCAIVGHADTVVRWGPWVDDPDMGRHRVVSEECVRCHAVVALASVVEGQPWTA